jgi:DNA-binding XRE family transcriptional regulator
MKHMKHAVTYDLPQLLIQCRTDRCLSLEDVAKVVKISRQALAQIERGRTRPRLTTERRIVQFLNKHGYFPNTEAAA